MLPGNSATLTGPSNCFLFYILIWSARPLFLPFFRQQNPVRCPDSSRSSHSRLERRTLVLASFCGEVHFILFSQSSLPLEGADFLFAASVGGPLFYLIFCPSSSCCNTTGRKDVKRSISFVRINDRYYPSPLSSQCTEFTLCPLLPVFIRSFSLITITT